MAKSSSLFMCSQCGNEFTKWSGQCPACHEWNTITEVNFTSPLKATKRSRTQLTALTPSSAIKSASKSTFSTNISELDRVLGPGITQGGVYLLAGEPGIGKSTLLTQLAISIAGMIPAKLQGSSLQNVLYLCSEETPSQVGTRISRLSTKTQQTEHINLLSVSVVEDLLHYLSSLPSPAKGQGPSPTGVGFSIPSLIIVDSIQSISSDQLPGIAGTTTQIRVCTNLLIHLAKSAAIPIILVGHVTKAGSIAGPKLLEHMVDAVLELEGDRHYDLRLLRGIKNRFGPTDETGIFRMDNSGLQPVTDPSQFFLTNRPSSAPGSCLTMIMEGTRPLIIEVQALTVHSELAIPRRVAAGIPVTKLQLICAILTKHLHLTLTDQDVFVNVTGGLNLREPAADLAVALSIISSFKNISLPAKSLAIGELGLLGEIRPVAYLDKRLKEAKNLGYSVSFTPEKYPTLKQIILK